MSAFPRESSFLPTIKCSSCGREIEISMMGDHVCSGPTSEPSPPPLDSYPSYNNPPPDKFDRMPPRVDTNAANRGYIGRGQLTPVSTSSGSRSLSPKTPDGRSVGARGTDYFEPAIANEYDTPPPQRRGPGGYGGFGSQDGYDADPMYPPSPKKQTNLLQRMNTIAPGPFDANPRPSAPRDPYRSRDQEQDDYGRGGYGSDRPGTSASNRSGFSSNGNSGGYAAPPRAPRQNGYGGFGAPQRQDELEPEPFSQPIRAGTFPRPSEPAQAPARTPSEPGLRPDRFRWPSNNMDARRPSLRADTSRPPPPRTSVVRPPTAGKDSGSIDLAAEFGVGNPFHKPTESMSSAISSYSQDEPRGQPGSRSSPSRSARNATPDVGLDDLMNDLQTSMEQMQPPTPQFGANNSLGSSRGRGAPGSRMRDPSADSYNLRSEMDRYNSSRQGSRDEYGAESGSLRAGRRAPERENGRMGGGGYGNFGGRLDPSPPRTTSPLGMRGGEQTLPPSRGTCKLCGEAIRGKSISSADGRLTGKYHKACFVCTTCREPFSSAEFYVLNDKPYCSIHYHKLNGSLCGSCGRGIEGQYLEDEAMVKYHVGCFRCGDCGMSLSNGYYEVDGKAYCERDAWRRTEEQQWAGANQNEPELDTLIPTPATTVPPSPAIPSPLPPPRDQMPMRGPPGMSRGPGMGMPMGLPSRPGGPQGGARPPQPRPLPPGVGLPRGQRLGPGMGPTPRPRMNKRNTRLGMM